MIIGNVNTNLEAIITLIVIGANQQHQEIKAVSETSPLVGMSLLEGYELNIQALAGGSVAIKILPLEL